MEKRILRLLFPLTALALELLPKGAVLRFGNPDGAPWMGYYSYFSLIPFGYANFGPLLTAVLTVVLLAILAIAVFRPGRGLLLTAAILAVLGTLTSFLPLMFGIENYTAIGACISAALLAEAVLCWYEVCRKKRTE